MYDTFDHSLNSASSQSLQHLDDRLARVERLTTLLGAKFVKCLIHEYHSTENDMLDTKASPANYLSSEVERLGVELNPTMVAEIVNSKFEYVQASIAIYKSYLQRGKVKNPNGLFYTILKEQQKSNKN